VIALAILSGANSNSTIKILGYEAVQLGNRKIILKAPAQMHLITNAEEIRHELHVGGDHAFAIAPDKPGPQMALLVGDYLSVGELDDLSKLLVSIQNDTSARIVTELMTEDELTLVLSPQGAEKDSSFYLFHRYTRCYPYYLRVMSGWEGTKDIPPSVVHALQGIEVRK